ncbi:MAG: hypothetical protein GTO63_30200 [Anaerolineae bacterium]|nr:hypothetical protein [Anaerolineae bacterium]NIN98977.1 hypothetical protein [Anaerolineae bacterium]
MPYFVTAQRASESAELYREIQETCVVGGAALVIPAGHRVPGTLANMVRAALTAAQEFPGLVADYAPGLKDQVIVKVRMRDNCVEVVPRPRSSRLSLSGAERVEAKRPVQSVDCGRRDFTIPSPDLAWLLDRLKEGITQFVNFNTHTSREEFEERLRQLGFEVEVWEVPEVVEFRRTGRG